MNCLNNAAEAGKLHSIEIGVRVPSVHHLLFADDSLLLCKANVLEAEEILNCFKLYGDASGQKINFEKSSIIFGSKVPDESKGLVQLTMGTTKE